MKEMGKIVGLVLVLLVVVVVLLGVTNSVEEERKWGRGREEGKEKTNGVFVYLVSEEKSVEGARENSHPVWDYVGDVVVSLRYLEKNFNSRYQYPIIIFHDGLSEETQQLIRRRTGESVSSLLTFHEISFDFPSSLASMPDEEKKEKLNGFTCTNKPWHLDYLHMNRFFTLNMYKNTYLQEYDYYFRVDSDLFFKQWVDFDLFAEMEDSGAGFVYWNDVNEPEGCVQGLGEAVTTYMKENNFETIPKINPRLAYHGCFGGGKLSFFRSEKYMDFAEYLNELGGIYYNRWADQVIYRIAFKIFGEEHTVQRWKNLGRYLQHNKRYPTDLCTVVPDHHKCGEDAKGRPVLISDSLKLEPRHSGAYAQIYPKRKGASSQQQQQHHEEL